MAGDVAIRLDCCGRAAGKEQMTRDGLLASRCTLRHAAVSESAVPAESERLLIGAVPQRSRREP